MGFVYPSFLWALTLAGIPIIIHLFNFRTYKTVYFSNSVFLENIVTESRQGTHIRDRLLLALRMGVMIFLVLAFARPFFSHKGQLGVAPAATLTIFYIDNSYSMGLRTSRGTLLDIAKRKCAEQVEKNSPDQRYMLLTCDFKGSDDRQLYRHDLLERLNQTGYSHYARNLNEVVSRGVEISRSVGQVNPEIVIYSDFQHNTLNRLHEVIWKKARITFQPVRPAQSDIKDVSIDSVWFTSPVFRPGFKTGVVVKMSATAGSKMPQLTMKVNGSEVAVNSNARPREGSVTRDTFTFIPPRAGINNLEFSVADDGLSFDNTLFATVNVRQLASVLLITGPKRSKFIKAVYAGDPYFKVTVMSEDQIDYGAFPLQNLIITDRLVNLSSGLAAELSRFIAKGGVVLYVPAVAENLNSQQTFLKSLKVGYPNRLITQTSKVLALDTHLDLFRGVFESIPRNATLPAASRYYKLAPTSAAVAEPILRLSSGDNLLTRYRIGKGKCYVSAAPYEDSSQTTQRQELFLPLMYQIALSGAVSGKYYYTLGVDKSIEEPPATGTAAVSNYRLLGKGVEIIPEKRGSHTGNLLFVSDLPPLPGFYRLESAGQALQAGYSFNDNRSEADLHYYNDQSIKELTGIIVSDDSDNVKPGNVASIAGGISLYGTASYLWKVCLIIALLLLAFEEILLHSGTRKNPTVQ